jgi:hypothetical protein
MVDRHSLIPLIPSPLERKTGSLSTDNLSTTDACAESQFSASGAT